MEQFARVVIGYHGCRQDFANAILLGSIPMNDWQKSENAYDWLGSGIYFWEHAPRRAQRWAEENYPEAPAVIGAVIQLGSCFDLMQEEQATFLGNYYSLFAKAYRVKRRKLPVNWGKEKKLRDLDCAVINDCLKQMAKWKVFDFDTVRGAFLEGQPLYPGTTLSSETHIQIAVRNVQSIVGVFRPNL